MRHTQSQAHCMHVYGVLKALGRTPHINALKLSGILGAEKSSALLHGLHAKSGHFWVEREPHSTYLCTKGAKCRVATRHPIRPRPFATYCFSFPGNLPQQHRWKISFPGHLHFHSRVVSMCHGQNFQPPKSIKSLVAGRPHSLPVCCILRTHHWACPCYTWIDPG